MRDEASFQGVPFDPLNLEDLSAAQFQVSGWRNDSPAFGIRQPESPVEPIGSKTVRQVPLNDSSATGACSLLDPEARSGQ